MWPFESQQNVSMSRHFYSTKRQTFETSLDVYTPREVTGPTVILVVGSGWMGHSPLIFLPTSWWNSSGPKSIAATGSVCICVRHPGAFFALPDKLPYFLRVCLLLMGIYSMIGMMVALSIMAIFALLKYLGRDAADFEDMLEGVADAVRYINENRTLLSPSSKSGGSAKQQPVFFGGYSSGGHVAVTLLQRWNEWDLPDKWIDGVVLVSGVLAVRPFKDELKPRWLTDLVMLIIWGQAAAERIPSPVALDIPKYPHLLIGCHSEMFGIPWLDVFFASSHYADKAESEKIPVKFIRVHSDHWNILASRQFQDALVEGLPWLAKAL